MWYGLVLSHSVILPQIVLHLSSEGRQAGRPLMQTEQTIFSEGPGFPVFDFGFPACHQHGHTTRYQRAPHHQDVQTAHTALSRVNAAGVSGCTERLQALPPSFSSCLLEDG